MSRATPGGRGARRCGRGTRCRWRTPASWMEGSGQMRSPRWGPRLTSRTESGHHPSSVCTNIATNAWGPLHVRDRARAELPHFGNPLHISNHLVSASRRLCKPVVQLAFTGDDPMFHHRKVMFITFPQLGCVMCRGHPVCTTGDGQYRPCRVRGRARVPVSPIHCIAVSRVCMNF